MVFILRNESDIHRFALDWFSDYEDEDIVMKNVKRWIVQAVMRNVEEINLQIRQGHPAAFQIPHQLLNCKSLTKLELQVNFGERCTDVILPKSIDLPRLKVMWVHGVAISNEELSKKLFSSCPVLEKLELYHCDIPNLTVNSLTLKNFVYKRFHSSLPNVIKLTAPNLKDLWCRSSVTQHYSLENCPLLSSVIFELIVLKERVFGENAEAYCYCPSEEEKVYAKHLVNFLRANYMVKVMGLSSGFLEVLSQAPELLDSQPPRLCNLQYLSMDMWSTTGCFRAITYLLKIFPRIIFVLLRSKESNLADVGNNWEAGFSSPGMLSHLKYVNFDEVGGSDAELKLLSFLLKHAKDLRRIFLSFRASIGSPDGVRQMKLFRDKVRALPAASSSVKVKCRFNLGNR
ncbi:putative F-box protein At3g44060 isoform X1 [Papaver somniferum]|uniref:putative F-box protein At3g44060 isoform X1 n=1 Tax=Papaver somniferum TaxID=3469 RepID=UPI000E6FBFAE|nr:putative F-box protein At3g44060 isoform X1 [Papaver somniferum]